MEKGRIAAHRHHRLTHAEIAELAQSLGQIDAGTHAVAGLVNIVACLLAAHDIASDIADHHTRFFGTALERAFQKEKCRPVRTSGAEIQFPFQKRFRLACRGIDRGRDLRQLPDRIHNYVRIQFPDPGKTPVPAPGKMDLKPMLPRQGLKPFFQERIHLFHNEHGLCPFKIVQ